MSVICKFKDFIFIKVQIFPSFITGKKKMSVKSFLLTFHEGFLISISRMVMESP